MENRKRWAVHVRIIDHPQIAIAGQRSQLCTTELNGQIRCGTIVVMLSPICEIETQLARALRLVHATAEAGARHEGGRRRIASSRGPIVTMAVVRADVPNEPGQAAWRERLVQ